MQNSIREFCKSGSPVLSQLTPRISSPEFQLSLNALKRQSTKPPPRASRYEAAAFPAYEWGRAPAEHEGKTNNKQTHRAEQTRGSPCPTRPAAAP